MSAGARVRCSRLFGRDGRTVVAALDHGIAGLNPLEHLGAPGALVESLAAAGADAFIVTPGIVQACGASFGRAGLIVRADVGATAWTGHADLNRPTLSARDALRLGADAIVAMGVVGVPGEAASLSALAELAADCQRWGLPLVAEMLPGGFTAGEVSAAMVASAARVGADLGADIIKIRYTGEAASFRAVTRDCYRPVIVLGGSKQPLDALLQSSRDALAAGAAGVAIGRNVWQAPEPATVVARLVEAVHA